MPGCWEDQAARLHDQHPVSRAQWAGDEGGGVAGGRPGAAQGHRHLHLRQRGKQGGARGKQLHPVQVWSFQFIEF